MSSGSQTVLITGATGRQGGAVARELAGGNFKLRAMTRKPEGDAARALAKLGAEIVRGDLDDDLSVERALEGIWGVFAVQNTWEAGVEKEEEQGKRIAQLARLKGVQHFVYTSVQSAQRKTGIPHFDNKWRIEETIRSLKFPSHTILRPVFFMENLLTPWFLNGDKLMAAMAPETSLQMIATSDIGKFGARAFTHASEMNGREVDIAGDAVTMPKAAELIGSALGRRIEFVRLPIEEVRKNSADTALMLEWFDRVGYNVDIPGLERAYGLRLVKLGDWLRQAARP